MTHLLETRVVSDSEMYLNATYVHITKKKKSAQQLLSTKFKSAI